MEKLLTWLGGSFDCLLPCWGGITPGKTSWQEAVHLLEPLSGFSTVNISDRLSCDFGECNGIGWSLFPRSMAEGHFYTRLPENIVHLINIKVENDGAQKANLMRSVNLRNIFTWYGSPDILLFSAHPNTSGDSFLELILVYAERQFVIRYLKLAGVSGDNVVSCGKDNKIELTILDNKEQLMSLDAIAGAVETKGLHVDSGLHKSADEAVGMTTHLFYLAFSNRKEPCISTPLSLWLP